MPDWRRERSRTVRARSPHRPQGPDRFVLLLDDESVGHARYSIADAVMTIPDVETVAVHRGKEFAARLMHGVLDDAREHGLTVAPHCGDAAAYMRRRPDTHDLLASNS